MSGTSSRRQCLLRDGDPVSRYRFIEAEKAHHAVARRCRVMRTELVLEALEMSVVHRSPDPGLIHHSDRGT